MSDAPEQPPGPPPQRPDYQRAAQDAMSTAQAAAKDAFATFMKLIYNPVGALPEAYGSLGTTQALGVGIVFVVVAVVCLLVSGGGMMSGFTGGALSMGFKGFLLGLSSTLACAVGIAAGSFLARLLFKGQGNLPFDVFIGGATLLPIGLGTLASYLLGLVGIGGVIGQLPVLVGGSLAVLVVFTGLARVAGIKEGLASYLVALVLAVGLFVAYLVTRMMVGILF